MTVIVGESREGGAPTGRAKTNLASQQEFSSGKTSRVGFFLTNNVELPWNLLVLERLILALGVWQTHVPVGRSLRNAVLQAVHPPDIAPGS
jgi:hypothetical protein